LVAAISDSCLLLWRRVQEPPYAMLHASRDLIIAELVVSNLADHQGMIA
jgi:hypothetical protein